MATPLSARIIEWNREKGFGYLNAGGGRLFLHARDFAQRYKKPEVGDVIQYSIGSDLKGRRCAVDAVHANEGGKITVWNLLLLLGLMFLPALASLYLELNPFLIAGYALVTAFVTFMLYAYDKARARAGQSRISEAMLHFFELIGGWPGGFLAQCRLRHKCTKGKFRILFWMIVILYQFAAIDFIYGWKISNALLQPVAAVVEQFQS